MRKIYRLVLSVALLFSGAAVTGQNISPVDFMPLNPYQLNTNPAADLPYQSVMSMFIGNVSFDVRNTGFRYDNLFDFDAQGRPVTINLRKFADGLKTDNYLGLSVNENVFFLCRQLNKGMISVGYNLRAQGSLKYNDGLFKLAAYGNGAFVGEDHPATIDMNLNAKVYQEFAVGYQWNVTEKLSLGGRAKLLFGFADVKTDAFHAKLFTDADSYALRLQENVAMSASLPGLFVIDDGLLKPMGRFSVADLFHNPGFGVDLGAEYRFNDQFGLVAAVNDLGFIHWGANNFQIKSDIADAGQFYDDGSFLFQGMDINQLQLVISDESYRELFLDTLKQYFHLDLDKGAYNTMLNTNILLRGYFDLNPNTRFVAQAQGQFVGNGFRPAFTLAYCGSFFDNLSICASYTAMPGSFTNFGLGFGAMIETCHIYLATNDIIGCFKPLNSSGFNAQVGIVFNLFKEKSPIVVEKQATPKEEE